ncbi:tyrosine-protein phosphatase [Leucobacter sp. UT-8R-CII-1-4]|uniref:tyrosine-protein phosphatase n=1 Tax=Leucobacter sp. UT-8R-CII-1-4 TaxID=3040075 RepID=UPI0024A99712|nr:tyrosine-protein phosphatase [Leucobacter sp. UT-8R-CII-1-4]MDI6022009.1 tyrosine-protein phosphatase [Leucobacter sp. UT-8R-CII-1-4]
MTESTTLSTDSEDRYARRVGIVSAPNLRDLGGIPTAAGEVTRGAIYRSATLSEVAEADMPAFAALGVHTVFDLRTADEIAAAPDRLPEGTDHRSLDVLADSKTSVAASLTQFGENPKAFAAMLAGGQAIALFEETYRDFLRLPSANQSYREFFLRLGDPKREGAALFHCTTGKDRTGWAAASLLAILGASDDDIYADYLQTNTDLLPALEPMIQSAQARGVDRELLLPVLGVQEQYLAAALDQMRTQYGTAHNYAVSGLGLSEAEVELLHERFTD